MSNLRLASLIVFLLGIQAHCAMTNPPGTVLKPLPYGAVTLLDGPFKFHQDLDRKVLLDMSPDRHLALFRKEAGLKPKAEPYGGWESQGVAGSVLGHYLTALSLMWKDTGDPEIGRRIDYIVGELAECQKANGGGYVAAIPRGRSIFADVRAGKPLRGWVPWYTFHKLLAGLRDAAITAGNAQAMQVWIGLGDFVCDTIAPLNQEQMQRMLGIEQGGMNEVMADLYAATGDAKYLDAARKFCHQSLFDMLTNGEDKLDGLHANTQIPKVIGFDRIYGITGEKHYHEAALFFWQDVTAHRSFVTGGNSDNEHFFPAQSESSHIDSATTAETCNVYNMLRLTRSLYAWDPKSSYMDFYERALYNQILGGQDPKKGMFTYFQPVGAGRFRIYSDPVNAGWCCLGTGMENPARYTESTYWTDASGITVALYQPSIARWEEKGVTLTTTTRFPADPAVSITIATATPKDFAVRLRAPGWLSAPMTVSINGNEVPAKDSGGYVTLSRNWKNGDVIQFTLPMRVTVEPATNDPSHIALLYGPVVLCGDLGTAGLDQVNFWQGDHNEKIYARIPVPPVPVLLCADPSAVAAGIKPVPGKDLTFSLPAEMQAYPPGSTKTPAPITLLPYSEMHFRRLATYWKWFTPADWETERSKIASDESASRELAARTVATIHPGEQQDDVDFHFAGKDSNSGIGEDGRHWRDAKGWFSYDVPERPDVPVILQATYWGGDDGRSFRILVDGHEIADETLKGTNPASFYDKEYPILSNITFGKKSVTARFEAQPGSVAGGIFGLRILTTSSNGVLPASKQ